MKTKEEEQAFKKTTKHFETRMYMRAFSPKLIELALQFGEEIYAQNSLYFFVGDRTLKKIPLHKKLKEKLRGVTVVCNPKTLELITCFRNPKFTRRIRHKK